MKHIHIAVLTADIPLQVPLWQMINRKVNMVTISVHESGAVRRK